MKLSIKPTYIKHKSSASFPKQVGFDKSRDPNRVRKLWLALMEIKAKSVIAIIYNI